MEINQILVMIITLSIIISAVAYILYITSDNYKHNKKTSTK